MTVTVQLFARARDLAGAAMVRVELAERATVAELKRRLAQDHPALAPLLGRSAMAVNSEFASDATVLASQDEVALLPPVSGG